MMDCKKALVETNGDMDAAIEVLRKKGQAKAEKKASRIAAEGICLIATDGDQKAAVVEVNPRLTSLHRTRNSVTKCQRSLSRL